MNNTIPIQSVKDNYYALFIAIKEGVTATKALCLMGITTEQRGTRKNRKTQLTVKEAERVIELKKDHTWIEIADMLNMRTSTLRPKIKEYMGDDWKNRGW